MPEEYPNIYIYKRIVQSKLFIDSHFSEDIDLNNISSEACFSKFHFIRLFKKCYGFTPYQYLMHVRIENAKIYLQDGYSVTECCYKVGFDSVSSFSILFRKCTNLSPTQFLAHFLKRKQLLQTAPAYFIPNCFVEQY